MKKLKYIYILLVVAFISACEDEAEKVTISSSPVAPALSSPGADGMEFVKADAANTIDYAWSEADFGFDASVTYNVEIALTSTFDGSAAIVTSQELTGSAVIADVNAVLLSWELPINESATISSRIVATVSDNVDPIYSEVSTFAVTPYETLIDYPLLYVPGAYQGWAPDADDAVNLYSYNFNTVYEGIVYFDAAGEFKITDGPSWDVNYGGTAGTLEQNGGNLSVAAAGAYKITADLGALTYSITATDHWAIIGDATPNGWGDPDTDMTYNGQRQMWEITTDLTAGELKFRANDGWDLNLGDNDADGSLEGGGANIAVIAGNYTIRLDVTNSTYQLIAN